MAATRKLGRPAAPPPHYLLVMTATIIPAVNAGIQRSDPQIRLEDYKTALHFWLAYPHPAADRILLLENSGASLAELEAIAREENPRNKPVEILSIPGNKIPEGRNYGYTEMQLLDDGLSQSRLREETTHMVKVTGRLTFPTVGKALDRIPKPFELMAECRKLGFPRRGFDASSQLFACSHRFYDRILRDSKDEMNSTDIRLLEHLIYRKIIPFKGQPGYHLRFPINIDPVGYSGFKSKSYNSPGAAVSRTIRAALRVIAPGWWY
jgi:hypothetical protein